MYPSSPFTKVWQSCSDLHCLEIRPFYALKLQLHDAIYRLRFYSNSLIHILSLSNSHNNVASIQKNRGDKSYRVIVALYELTSHCTLKRQFSPKVAHKVRNRKLQQFTVSGWLIMNGRERGSEKRKMQD